jgi:MarR family transcriptional repressor of emrRAB
MDMSQRDCPVAEGRLARRASEVEAVIRRMAAQSSELPVVETLIQWLVVLLGRDLSALLEHSLASHGLSETDYRTLVTLQSLPGGIAHPGDLCDSVGRSPANMTRIADGLCERGLITRVPSDEDRRRTVLRITPAGAALVSTVIPQSAQRTASIFTDIAPAARDTLLGQLRALIASVDRYICQTVTPHAAGAGERAALETSADPQAPPPARG